MSLCLNVPVAQDLDSVKLEPSPNQYQQIPKHPAGILGVGRWVHKRNILVLARYASEEAVLELSQRSNNPLEANFISWSPRCGRPVTGIRNRTNFLGQEEPVLSLVSAVPPCPNLVNQSGRFLASQLIGLFRFTSPPDRVRMQSWKCEPVAESVFLQIGE